MTTTTAAPSPIPLMQEIARLSEREYVDEYVPARTGATSV